MPVIPAEAGIQRGWDRFLAPLGMTWGDGWNVVSGLVVGRAGRFLDIESYTTYRLATK